MAKKSTKTENKSEAITAAKGFFNGLLLKQSQNLPLTASNNFERVAKSLMAEDQRRVDRKEVSPRLVRDEKYIFEKDLIPHFRKYNVKDIDYPLIQEYVARLNERELSTNTIKLHFTYLHKVLKHAWQMKLIAALPMFPKVQTLDNPRLWFNPNQYKHLKSVIVQQIKAGAVVQYQPITDELRFLVTFMVNSFLRPSDIKVLQNKHIAEIKTKTAHYLKIQALTKVDPSPTITMADAVGIYNDLTQFNKAKGFGSPDDYVFFPALKGRTHAIKIMGLQFKHVAEKADLKSSPEGGERTLHSLRHSAIMFRLLNGGQINLMTLARNARTSVEVIDRFYARHLQAEMQVEQLQSFGKQNRS